MYQPSVSAIGRIPHQSSLMDYHSLKNVYVKAELYSLGKQTELQLLPLEWGSSWVFPWKASWNDKAACGISQDSNSQSFPSPWNRWQITFTEHIHGYTWLQISAPLRQAAGSRQFWTHGHMHTPFSPTQQSIRMSLSESDIIIDITLWAQIF